MLCLATPGPGTWQKPLQFSILDWLCGGQAGCAGQTSEAAHHGFCSNYYSEAPAWSKWPLSQPWWPPSPPSSGLPCKLQSQQLHRTPQPVVFFLWTHRKCHLLLRKITAFGWI